MFQTLSLFEVREDGGPVQDVLDLLSTSMPIVKRIALIQATRDAGQNLLQRLAELEAENAALKEAGAVLPDPQPQTVTKRQLKLWLLNAGLLDAVEAMLNAIPDETQRREALINWNDASVFERQHPLTLQLAGMLNLDAAAIDQAFAAAALL